MLSCQPLTCTLVCIAAICTAPCGIGNAEAGLLTGTLALPSPSALGKPPQHSKGFLPRIANQLKPVRLHDPRSYMIVVLDGDIPAAFTQAPKRPIEIVLRGESFSSRIAALVSGSRVLIRNKSRAKPRLYSPTDSELFPDSSPIPPKATREIKIQGVLKSFIIRDRDSVHLEMTLLALPHTLFAPVEANGSFKIKGVPPGNWRVRVWYQGSWLTMPEPTVNMVPRGAQIKITLPAGLATKKSK